MSHTIHDKDRLLARVRRIKGQLEGVERAIEREATCGEVLHQLASVRGAMNGLAAEVMEDHLREHVLVAADQNARREGVDDIIQVLRTYMK